jgi:uncharacterized membrane protein AbrB (regulator of aidB expression)
MHLSRSFIRALTVALLVLLFLGTLMPGAWKDAATRPFHTGLDLPALAHITLFAGICSLLPLACFWQVKIWHVPAIALFLALLTEGLQFFAIDRHPNLAGVLQDLTGGAIGWWIGYRLLALQARAAALPAKRP